MKMQIFAMFDKKALCYMSPKFYQHTGQAVRALEDVMQEKNIISDHPADFDLYKIGTFDDESGIVSPVMTDGENPTALPPQFVQTALSFQKNKPQSINPEIVHTNGKGK